MRLRVVLGCMLLLVVFTAQAQPSKQLSLLYAQADSSLTVGNYDDHLQYCLEALKIVESGGDCNQQAETYRRLGVAYDFLKNRPASLKWLYQALHLSKNCAGADTIYMRTARYIGAMFFGVQQGDSSIIYLNTSAQMMLKYGYTAEAASAYGMMGEAYSTILLDTAMAVKQYLQSISLARKSKDNRALGYALFRYGCHLARNNACLKGRPFIDSSYILFKELKDVEGQRWALNGLAYAESRCGSGELVYNHMSAIQAINDSLFRLETARQSANYAALYEKEKQDKDILQLRQKTRFQRIWAGIIIGGILLLSAIGYLILNRRALRNRQRAELALYDMQLNNYASVIEAENAERKRIASALHDSIGQLLSAVKMQLSLVEKSEPNIEKANIALDEAAREVRHISHNLMPASLKELGLIAALRQMARTMSVEGRLDIIFEHHNYNPQSGDREIAIYRIIQELVTNSIKHASPDRIQIDVRVEDQTIVIMVADNGKGFDATQLEQTSGIGMKNIAARINLLKGTIHIQSEPGKGSTFTIALPA